MAVVGGRGELGAVLPGMGASGMIGWGLCGLGAMHEVCILPRMRAMHS